MNAQCRYAKIGVSVSAWSAVLLTTTYLLRNPVALGPSSWGYAALLGLLVCIAVMADPLCDYTMNAWSKKVSHTRVVTWGEGGMGRAMANRNAVMMGWGRTLSEAQTIVVSLFLYCKRATRYLMSSGSHL